MSSNFSSAISVIIQEDIDRLSVELEVLKPRLADEKEGMFITHNGEDILVYGPLNVKAFIPKKYNGWKIQFIDSADKEFQIDLDLQIDTE